MLDRLIAHWPLKLLALALAFAIWVSVTGENRIVQDFSLPLEIRLSDDRVLACSPPNTVTVRLRGPEGLMRRLDPVPIALRVDLRDAPPGAHDIQLSASSLVNVPRGVEVDFIDPDRLNLTLDRRMGKELPVEPTFLGQPPEGYAFYGAEVFPDTLIVEGPESEVQPLEVVRTNPVRLDQHTEPFQIRVGAVPEGTYVRAVDPRPLEVRVDVDASPVERRFADLPVEIVGGGEGATVSPSSLNVTLSGPPPLVDRVRPEQIRVVADASDLPRSGPPRNVAVRVEFVEMPKRNLNRIAVKTLSRREVSVRTGVGGGG